MYLVSLGLYWGKWDLVPWLGIEPGPLRWEQGVLATGPPGRSQCIRFFEKVFIEFVTILLLFYVFFFFWLGHEVFGIFTSQAMIEPAPPALEGKVLITREIPIYSFLNIGKWRHKDGRKPAPSHLTRKGRGCFWPWSVCPWDLWFPCHVLPSV